MRRREFIAIAGGAAAVWPFASSAQQVPVIGFLGSSSSAAQVGQAAFRQGLKEAGYIEGQNIAIEFRWSEGDYTQLPALAANLVSRRVAVIVASGLQPLAPPKRRHLPSRSFSAAAMILLGLVSYQALTRQAVMLQVCILLSAN